MARDQNGKNSDTRRRTQGVVTSINTVASINALTRRMRNTAEGAHGVLALTVSHVPFLPSYRNQGVERENARAYVCIVQVPEIKPFSSDFYVNRRTHQAGVIIVVALEIQLVHHRTDEQRQRQYNEYGSRTTRASVEFPHFFRIHLVSRALHRLSIKVAGGHTIELSALRNHLN